MERYNLPLQLIWGSKATYIVQQCVYCNEGNFLMIREFPYLLILSPLHFGFIPCSVSTAECPCDWVPVSCIPPPSSLSPPSPHAMRRADETCRLAQYSSAAATPTSPHKAECTPVLQGEKHTALIRWCPPKIAVTPRQYPLCSLVPRLSLNNGKRLPTWGVGDIL